MCQTNTVFHVEEEAIYFRRRRNACERGIAVLTKSL